MSARSGTTARRRETTEPVRRGVVLITAGEPRSIVHAAWLLWLSYGALVPLPPSAGDGAVEAVG